MLDKRQRKPNEQSKIDNPENLATLSTQDAVQTKQKTQHGKQKR